MSPTSTTSLQRKASFEFLRGSSSNPSKPVMKRPSLKANLKSINEESKSFDKNNDPMKVCPMPRSIPSSLDPDNLGCQDWSYAGLVAYAAFSKIYILDAHYLQILRDFSYHSNNVSCLKWLPQQLEQDFENYFYGRLALSGAKTHGAGKSSAKVNSSSIIASGDVCGNIFIYDTVADKAISQFQLTSNSVIKQLEWVCYGKSCCSIIYVTESNNIVLYDLKNKKKLWSVVLQFQLSYISVNPFDFTNIFLVCNDNILEWCQGSPSKPFKVISDHLYIISDHTTSSNTNKLFQIITSKDLKDISNIGTTKMTDYYEVRGFHFLPCNQNFAILGVGNNFVCLIDTPAKAIVFSFSVNSKITHLRPYTLTDSFLLLHQDNSISVYTASKVNYRIEKNEKEDYHPQSSIVDVCREDRDTNGNSDNYFFFNSSLFKYELKHFSDCLRNNCGLINMQNKVYGVLLDPYSHASCLIFLSSGCIVGLKISDSCIYTQRVYTPVTNKPSCISVFASLIDSNVDDSNKNSYLPLVAIGSENENIVQIVNIEYGVVLKCITIPCPTGHYVIKQIMWFNIDLILVVAKVANPIALGATRGGGAKSASKKLFHVFLVTISTGQIDTIDYELHLNVPPSEAIITGCYLSVPRTYLMICFENSLAQLWKTIDLEQYDSKLNPFNMLAFTDNFENEYTTWKKIKFVFMQTINPKMGIPQQRPESYVTPSIKKNSLINLTYSAPADPKNPGSAANNVNNAANSDDLMETRRRLFVVACEWSCAVLKNTNDKLNTANRREHLFCTTNKGQYLCHFVVTQNKVTEHSSVSLESSMTIPKIIVYKSDILVTADNDGNISVWNIRKKTSVMFQTKNSDLYKLKFAPGKDCYNFLYCCKNRYQVWDAINGKILFSSKITDPELMDSVDNKITVVDIEWLSNETLIILKSNGEVMYENYYVIDDKIIQSKKNSSVLKIKIADEHVLVPGLFPSYDKKLCVYNMMNDDFGRLETAKNAVVSVNYILDIMKSKNKETSSLVDKYCYYSSLMRDKNDEEFWSVTKYFIDKYSGNQSKFTAHKMCELFDNDEFKKKCLFHLNLRMRAIMNLNKIIKYEGNDELRRHCVRWLAFMNERKAAINAILQTESGDAKYIEDYRNAIALACVNENNEQDGVVKLVASSFIANENVYEGVQLLCLMGKSYEACKYLLNSNKIDESFELAKLTLTGEQYKEFLKVLLVDKNLYSLIEEISHNSQMVSVSEDISDNTIQHLYDIDLSDIKLFTKNLLVNKLYMPVYLFMSIGDFQTALNLLHTMKDRHTYSVYLACREHSLIEEATDLMITKMKNYFRKTLI